MRIGRRGVEQIDPQSQDAVTRSATVLSSYTKHVQTWRNNLRPGAAQVVDTCVVRLIRFHFNAIKDTAAPKSFEALKQIAVQCCAKEVSAEIEACIKGKSQISNDATLLSALGTSDWEKKRAKD